MSGSKSSRAPRLAGRSLRAAVAAAESPMVGAGFKQLMFRQLGLDKLMAVEVEEHPVTMPTPHPSSSGEGEHTEES